MAKTIVPTVPSLGPISGATDPTVRRALQTLADAHNARNGATDRRFVTAEEAAAQAGGTARTRTVITSTDDDAIAALNGAIESLQSIVSAMRSHSTTDGYDVGNGAGQVPMNNGVVSVGLNAEKIGGKTIGELLVRGAVTTGTKVATGDFLEVDIDGVTRYLQLFATP